MANSNLIDNNTVFLLFGWGKNITPASYSAVSWLHPIAEQLSGISFSPQNTNFRFEW